jgi:hypothetical protein
MTFKELREICIAEETKERTEGWFLADNGVFQDTTFDELCTEIKEHGKHYYSAFVELSYRLISTHESVTDIELVEDDGYDRQAREYAKWLQCVDAELGTNYYDTYYDSDVEQSIKEYHEEEEREKMAEAQAAAEDYAISHPYMFGVTEGEIESLINGLHGY